MVFDVKATVFLESEHSVSDSGVPYVYPLFNLEPGLSRSQLFIPV